MGPRKTIKKLGVWVDSVFVGLTLCCGCGVSHCLQVFAYYNENWSEMPLLRCDSKLPAMYDFSETVTMGNLNNPESELFCLHHLQWLVVMSTLHVHRMASHPYDKIEILLIQGGKLREKTWRLIASPATQFCY